MEVLPLSTLSSSPVIASRRPPLHHPRLQPKLLASSISSPSPPASLHLLLATPSALPPPRLPDVFVPQPDQDWMESLSLPSWSYVVHSLWLGLVLQWAVALETRRSFLRGFLQQHAERLFKNRYPPVVVTPQFTAMGRLHFLTRRIALVMPFMAVTSTALNSMAADAAVEENSIGNSILRNLGIGDADIYYPRIFEGSWNCNSTLVAVDTPQGEDKADKKSVDFSRKQLGYTVEYKARFIPFGKNVIGDRLYTTLSLVESTVGNGIVDHGIWTPEQPDRLTLVLRGGVKVQNFVTKRSSSLFGSGRFDTSEYSQQVFDNTRLEGGPPIVKASQNRTRYRWDPVAEQVSTIEAFQRVSMFPVPQEGLTSMDILGMDKPVTVYKYIVRFTRDSSL